MKFLLCLSLLSQLSLAGWTQFQRTPDNHGRDSSVYLDRAKIDTVLKFNLGMPMYAAPVVSGDTIIASRTDGTVYAINWKSAKILWTYHAPAGIASTPAMDDGLVYVGARNGCVYALNRFTGVPHWTFSAEDTIAAEREIQAPIKMTRDRLYVGCFNGKLYCLDKSGRLKWAFQTHYYIKEAPAVRDSLIALSSRDEAIYLLEDLGDSVRLIWKNRVVEYGDYVPGSVARAAPVIAGDYVLTNSTEAELGHFTRALSLDSGRKAMQFSDNGNFNTTGFAVTGDGVILSNIWGYNSNPLGKKFGISGSYQRYRCSNAAPILIGNYAVFHSSFYPKGIYLTDPVSFALRDSLPMRSYTLSSGFCAADSVIFFGTFEGFLLGMGNGRPAIGTATGERPSAVTVLNDVVISPNPFNPQTGVCFKLADRSRVTLRAVDVRGSLVWSYARDFAPGRHTIRWNALNLPAGLYFLRFHAGNFQGTYKVILAK